MTVKILLLTHKEVGNQLIDAAKHTLGDHIPTSCVSISVNESNRFEQTLLEQLDATLNNATDGVLILTDLYGSTPCNIAKDLSKNKKCEIVTGLNLPMLLKTLNYYELPLNELAKKALEGGKACIKKV